MCQSSLCTLQVPAVVGTVISKNPWEHLANALQMQSQVSLACQVQKCEQTLDHFTVATPVSSCWNATCSRHSNQILKEWKHAFGSRVRDELLEIHFRKASPQVIERLSDVFDYRNSRCFLKGLELEMYNSFHNKLLNMNRAVVVLAGDHSWWKKKE